MKTILAIQSRQTPERQASERAAYERAAGGKAVFAFISTLDVEQSWDDPAEIVRGHDGVLIGGSSDFFLHGGKDETDATRAGAREVLDRVRTLVEYLVERQVPTLGICFGHQLIAEVYGGAVTHDHAQKKAGTHEVRLTGAGADDVLFGPLAPAFEAQYAHRDSITRPPLGAVVLAEGGSCRFAALRYGQKCYTVQFHPELVAQDFLSQPEALAVYLPEGASAEDLVRETPQAGTLIGAFVELVAGPPLDWEEGVR
jgi:GMP synthase-like glutamine amidotransferase